MTPLDYYYEQCRQGLITEDAEQVKALTQLGSVYHALLAESRARSRLFRFLRSPQVVKGAYLSGGVGIGKTYVMDCLV